MDRTGQVQTVSRETRAELRRILAVDAATQVLAARGGRGLTHREVDRRLDWPAGSTSNYFRRREDLVTAVGARLMERDLADLIAILEAEKRRGKLSVDVVIDVFVRLFKRWMEPENHIYSLARLEVLVERVRYPALRRATEGAISSLHVKNEELFARMGVSDPRRAGRTFAKFASGIHLLIAQREPSLSDQALRALVESWLTISFDTAAG
jgi:AcrR family transcriptional regulator